MNEKIINEIRRLALFRQFSKNPCFYLYDLGDISQKLTSLSTLLSKSKVYYAMKANPNRTILRHIKSSGLISGVEIASAGELEKALEFFSPQEIIFTGPAKTQFELDRAVVSAIQQINLESYTEALRLNRSVGIYRACPAVVALRVNVNYFCSGGHTLMAGGSTKLGVDEENVLEEIRRINLLRNLHINGIHVFAGSGLLDFDQILAYFNHVFKLVRRVETGKSRVSHIDLGGGFGIDYSGAGSSLDLSKLGGGLEKLVNEFGFSNKEILLEIGRYIVGECGYYVTQVVDIKESRGKKHIIAAGGINHQRRPCAVEMNHPVEIIPFNSGLLSSLPFVCNEVVDIDGPLCLNDDFLAKNIFVERANIGDLVVVKQSGAYGFSMAAVNFLSHPAPKEYFIN